MTEVDKEEDYKPLTDEQILNLIQGPLAGAEEFWIPYKDIYSRLENLYFGNIRDDSAAKDLSSQLSSGEAFEIVETILPRMIANKIRARLSGVEQSDVDAARFNEQILDWQMESQYLEKPFEDWIRQAAKTIGALQVDVSLEKMKVYGKKRKYTMTLPKLFGGKQLGVGPLVDTVEEKDVFKHILEPIPWDQLIVVPATSTDTMPLIGKKLKRKISYLEDHKDEYKNVDKLKEAVGKTMFLGELPTYTGTDIDQYRLGKGDQQEVNWTAANQLIIEAEVDCYELYAQTDDEIYKVEYQPDFTLVLKSECMDNWHGMLPIRLLSLIPVEGQNIGLSPLQTSENLIDAMDTWVNLLLEMGIIDVNRPVAYDKKQIGINWRVNPPRYKAGESIPVNGNPNNVFAVLQTPKIDGSHQWVLNWIRNRIQNKSGVTDYIGGGDSGGPADQTLGEIQLKTAQSVKRFEMNLKHIRREMSKVFFMMVSNNQQYMPDGYPVRVLGQRGSEYRKLRPEAIQGRFDFTIRGYDSVATEDSETIAKYRAMLTDAMNPLVRPFVNVYEIVRGLFEDGYKTGQNTNILITPQERLQDQDQQMQQQAMKADQENHDPQTAIVRPDDNHAVHLDVHMLFVKSPEFKKLPAPLQMMLARHIEAHRAVMAQGGSGANPSQNPGMPSGPGGPGPLQPPVDVGSVIPPSQRTVGGPGGPLG